MNENNPLVTELTARAGGASAADAAAAARAGSSGLGDLPGRTAIAVAASVLAVAAIAAASWGLSRHDGQESATPNAPESSDITFGPNQPDSTPTSLPTLPEASTPGYPSNDVFSTPSYPTASAPSVPSYTAPDYPYSTRTTPYSPYTPSPTTTPADPTWSPTTGPTKVTPAAPTATPISRCGTYGVLQLANTTGVRYSLVVGDGHEGLWVVRATARKGYAIASGATTRFSGHLGQFQNCPATIREVTTAATGDPDTDPWQVTVTLAVPETEKRAISVVYVFDAAVTVSSQGGTGWTCTGPGETGLKVTCEFGDPGTKPPPVFLKVSPSAPSGTVRLYAGSKAVDVESFA